jgi:hypothetical protein
VTRGDKLPGRVTRRHSRCDSPRIPGRSRHGPFGKIKFLILRTGRTASRLLRPRPGRPGRRGPAGGGPPAGVAGSRQRRTRRGG